MNRHDEANVLWLVIGLVDLRVCACACVLVYSAWLVLFTYSPFSIHVEQVVLDPHTKERGIEYSPMRS